TARPLIAPRAFALSGSGGSGIGLIARTPSSSAGIRAEGREARCHDLDQGGRPATSIVDGDMRGFGHSSGDDRLYGDERPAVGLERPRLMGLWDRSQPTAPGLGDDYYAQAMHGADDRSGALASRSERGGNRSEGEEKPDAEARGVETEASANRAEAMRGSTA